MLPHYRLHIVEYTVELCPSFAGEHWQFIPPAGQSLEHLSTAEVWRCDHITPNALCRGWCGRIVLGFYIVKIVPFPKHQMFTKMLYNIEPKTDDFLRFEEK